MIKVFISGGVKMNKVCVLGSINMDLVIKVNSMPKVGETILSEDMKKIPGGKGANQAIAAKRSGSEVHIIGKVGKDEYGKVLTEKLSEDGIEIKNIFKDDNKNTGMALITVNKAGNNSIIVVSGSNMSISKKDILKAESVIEYCDILVSQLEVPIERVREAFIIAKKYNKLTVLNPSPSKEIHEQLMKNTDMIIPNENEAYDLTGIKVQDLESCRKAAQFFIERGVKVVIITLGEKGAAIITENHGEIIPAYRVKVVDTTAAGDSFLGALVSKIDSKDISFESIKEGVKFGNQVSSITIQRKGAQPSIPYAEEVEKVYR
ncbi:MAG: rbsK [Clostridium sp.]|jgi:ribokinase|nr:rbsK [Clostridium sp.]